MHTMGSITLTVGIQGRRYQDLFHVFSSLSQEVILGRPFLQKYQAKIDFQKEEIMLDKGLDVHSVSLHNLKPGESVLVAGEITETTLPNGLNGYIGSIQRPNGLQTQPCVATNCYNKVPIVIRNTSNEVLQIPKGYKIGSFKPMKADEDKDDEPSNKMDTTIHEIQAIIEKDKDKRNDNIKSTLNIDLSHCTTDDKAELETLLWEHKQAFSQDGSIGFNDWLPMEIKVVPGTIPFARQPYRLPPDVKLELERQIQKLLQQGIIIEESSDWASPVLAVRKQAPRARRFMRDKTKKPEIRLVVDYRYLNACTIPVQSHIPNTLDILDEIAQTKPKYFTSLDANSGFWQQALDPDSRKYTGFLFNKKSYTWTRVAQGFINSPRYFSRLIHKILEDVGDSRNIHVYIDDCLICSSTKQEHIQLLQKVLQAFIKANISLSGKKCEIMKTSITFLGYQLSEKGISVSDKHKTAMSQWPIPKTVRDLKSFVGCCNFFKRLIPNRGEVMAKLTKLTRKGTKFNWTEEQQQAFDYLKDLLSEPPVLKFPDFSKQFHVYTDASTSGIAGVLCQEGPNGQMCPVAYTGRATNETEKNWNITELEALAVFYCCSEWEVYLSSKTWTLYTDHSALLHIFKGNTKLTPKLSRYSMFLSQFDYNIEHIRGVRNIVADGLSRRAYDKDHTTTDDKMEEFPMTPSIQAITRAQSRKLAENKTTNQVFTDTESEDENQDYRINEREVDEDDKETQNDDDAAKDNIIQPDGIDITRQMILEAQKNDEFCMDLRNYIERGILPRDKKRRRRCMVREFDYTIDQDLVCQIWTPILRTGMAKLRILIPKPLQIPLIASFHNNLEGAHLGTLRMVGLLRDRYIFSGMYGLVQKYVNNCDICHRVKSSNKRIQPLPGIFDVTEQCFQRCHTDCLGPLPITARGNRYVAICVESLSGYIIAWPQRSLQAEHFARQFCAKVCYIYGPPRTLVLDNASYYRGNLWQTIAKVIGCKLIFSSPYNPRGNSFGETSVKKIMNCLRCMCSNNQNKWDEFLAPACYALNNTKSSVYGLTPYNVLFGRDGREVLDNKIDTTTEVQPLYQILQDMALYREKAIQTAIHFREMKAKLAKENMADKVDMSHKPFIGDVVFWSRPKSQSIDGSTKFLPKQEGPYAVIARSRHTAKLQDLNRGRIHKIPIHISQLSVANDYQRQQINER